MALRVQTKMADVVATIKIMPESPEVDMDALQAKASEKVRAFAGNDEQKIEIEPVAFGLKALKITFVMDEDKGSPDALEEDLRTLENVNSVETIDVRRAMG